MKTKGYQRYHIETKHTADIVPLPPRFRVQVKKRRLALLLFKELIHYRGNLKVVASRPCVYGVFSGPVGGFAPREKLCVGCLRCTTEHPDVVQIFHNPKRRQLGDSYFHSEFVDSVCYEAETGRIFVRGAGYRGRFGGKGWDSLWTDMSEIVRPTRDGIHGREFISTVVDLGPRPQFVEFGAEKKDQNSHPSLLSIPVPFLIDCPPDSAHQKTYLHVLSQTAHEAQTLAILPIEVILKEQLSGPHLIPLVGGTDLDELAHLPFQPQMIELESADDHFVHEVRTRYPHSPLCFRLEISSGFETTLLNLVKPHGGIVHLACDYHGRTQDGQFVMEAVRQAHQILVKERLRDQVTLIGSGGIVAAEHVAKAILCGLDAVALDTPLLMAVEAQFSGECADPETSRFALPKMEMRWGVQRLKNLMASWRDQLLEVLGAMGLREVRRLRGEWGRGLFQRALEKEAFGNIAGYE